MAPTSSNFVNYNHQICIRLVCWTGYALTIAFRFTAEERMSVFATVPGSFWVPPSPSSGGYQRPFTRVERSGLEAYYLLLSSSGEKNTWNYNSLWYDVYLRLEIINFTSTNLSYLCYMPRPSTYPLFGQFNNSWWKAHQNLFEEHHSWCNGIQILITKIQSGSRYSEKRIFLCDTSHQKIIPFSGLKYKSNYPTIQYRLDIWSEQVEEKDWNACSRNCGRDFFLFFFLHLMELPRI